MENYNFFVYYSEEDRGYIGIIPDLPFLSAFGETPQEAVQELMVAKEGWLEAAKLEGLEIPKPKFNPNNVFGRLSALSSQLREHKIRISKLSEDFETLGKAVSGLTKRIADVKEANNPDQDSFLLLPDDEEYSFARTWRGRRT